MASPIKAWDVWFISGNTVYRGVPMTVITDWAQQGRLGASDKIKPAGANTDWGMVGEHATIADFLFVKKDQAPTSYTPKHNEELEPIEMDHGLGGMGDEDDEEVDMIPLIDISLVLLIFFMMTATVSALSPIEVPAMKNGAELQGQPDNLTVQIDKNAREEVYFAVRIGDKSPEKEDTDLPSMNELLARVNIRLNEQAAAGKKPTEVRIACHKDLPSETVHDMARELQRLKDAGKILSYAAEVNESK
ncbi:MAG: ExbD/TolR family protein [Gemmataceae bacterium]